MACTPTQAAVQAAAGCTEFQEALAEEEMWEAQVAAASKQDRVEDW